MCILKAAYAICRCFIIGCPEVSAARKRSAAAQLIYKKWLILPINIILTPFIKKMQDELNTQYWEIQLHKVYPVSTLYESGSTEHFLTRV